MEIESSLELYDSDMVKIRGVYHQLNKKYSSKTDSKENLLSLVREAEDLFRGAGFVISVSLSKQIAYAMGAEPTEEASNRMTFVIESRVAPEIETDYDKMAWEAKRNIIPDQVADTFLERGGTQDSKVEIDPVYEELEREQ